MVRRAPQHHAIDFAELAIDRVPVGEPAVDDDRQRRKIALQPVDDVVAQRRHFAVLLRREPLQHRVARMDDEHAAAGRGNDADEIADEAVVVAVVESDAMLDRDRNRHCVTHRPDAFGDQRRLGHQAGAETAGLHPLGRAAAVEIDLVVAPALAQLRARRRGAPGRCRRAAAQADVRPDRSRDDAGRRRATARRT